MSLLELEPPERGVPGRAPRRRAVWPTERDVAVLRWIAEMFCAREDLVGVLLAQAGGAPKVRADRLGQRAVRAVTDRWVRAGWAERRRMLDRSWVLPTEDGYRLAGIEPRHPRRGDPLPGDPGGQIVMEPWVPRAWLLPHVHAVGVVRAHLEAGVRARGGQDVARWVSERELRREVLGSHFHVFDGAVERVDQLVGPEGKQRHPRRGIEVELSLKSSALFQRTFQRPLGGPWLTGVTYYTPAPLVGVMQERIAAGAGRMTKLDVRVEALPELGIDYLKE